MGVLDARIRSFRFPRSSAPVVQGIDLSLQPGEFVVLAGPPGAGKTTLCHCLAGVIPHFVHGDYDGQVLVGGQSLSDLRLPQVAGLLGYVLQVPTNQLFHLSVYEDVAFGPENLGLPPAAVRTRVEHALRAVGIAHLAHRAPHTLSGGEQQRAVLASMLALDPQLWLLDQPVAALDPVGRAEVYEVIQRLRETGRTILVVEERLNEVAALASRVVLLEAGRITADAPPSVFFADPAVLGRGLRLPLAIQLYHLLRARGIELPSVPLTPAQLAQQVRWAVRAPVATAAGALNGRGSALARGVAPIASLRALKHRYRNGTLALRGLDLDLYPGECVAIIGQNGAGKTTLAKHLIGLLRPTAGEVRVLGKDTRSLTTAQVARHVGYLFQDPDYQIFCPSVVEEAAFGLQARGVPAVEARRRAMRELERVGLADLADAHPYRLSRGQRQLLALASVLACEPALLVVDEPSTGLDYYQTRRIMEHLDAYRAGGRSVVLITHDIEMVARYAQRCVVLKEGRVLAEAPVEELGDLTDELLAAGVRLPEVYEFLAALDLPPTFCEAEALADWLAGEPSANARRRRAVQPQLGRG